MTYYNTTQETGQDLREFQQKAQTQDSTIATFFELNPGQMFTPWEIQSLAFTPPAPPITSVRRSMNTLTRAGLIEKTRHLKEVGEYGRRSFAWRLIHRPNVDWGPWEPKGGQIKKISPKKGDSAPGEGESENGPDLQGRLF